jgi:hypothetical protein
MPIIVDSDIRTLWERIERSARSHPLLDLRSLRSRQPELAEFVVRANGIEAAINAYRIDTRKKVRLRAHGFTTDAAANALMDLIDEYK